jgi:hypothetical protein
MPAKALTFNIPISNKINNWTCPTAQYLSDQIFVQVITYIPVKPDIWIQAGRYFASDIDVCEYSVYPCFPEGLSEQGVCDRYPVIVSKGFPLEWPKTALVRETHRFSDVDESLRLGGSEEIRNLYQVW